MPKKAERGSSATRRRVPQKKTTAMTNPNKVSVKARPAGAGKKKTFETRNLHERIREKAYQLYLQRGDSHGSDMQDWFEAEKLVKIER